MTPLARDARRVLFDASPLVHLGQAGLLFRVAGYLGARAAVVRDVHNELVRNRDRFPDLRPQLDSRWSSSPSGSLLRQDWEAATA